MRLLVGTGACASALYLLYLWLLLLFFKFDYAFSSLTFPLMFAVCCIHIHCTLIKHVTSKIVLNFVEGGERPSKHAPRKITMFDCFCFVKRLAYNFIVVAKPRQRGECRKYAYFVVIGCPQTNVSIPGTEPKTK